MSKKRKILRIYKILDDYYGDLKWWPANGPFEVIVGAILTQNTNWRNVQRAVDNLRLENLLIPERLRRAEDKLIESLIKPCGYYRVKTRRLRKFLDFFFDEYESSIEGMFSGDWGELRKKLLKVNGIGEETADSILLYAGQKPVFVVDQYTKRICSRHGLIDERAAYGEVQRLFMERLPAEAALYNQCHALLVNAAKDFCKKEPRCSLCPLGNLAAG
jgi:endonuclease-3 related protein